MYQFHYTVLHIPTNRIIDRIGYFKNEKVLTAKLNRWNNMGKDWKHYLTEQDIMKNKYTQFLRYLPPLSILWTGEYEHNYIYNHTVKDMEV